MIALGVDYRESSRMVQVKGDSSAAADTPVYLQLKDLLVNYAFFPGSRLHVQGLAESLKVSSTPVREALHRLCAEHLLTAIPRQGFFVKKLELSQVVDLYEAKHVLLSFSVSKGLRRFRPEEDPGFLPLIDVEPVLDPENGEEGVTGFIELSDSLIQGIAALSDNDYVSWSTGNLLDRLRFVRLTELRLSDNRQAILDEHIAMTGALRHKNQDVILAVLNDQLTRELSNAPALVKECVNRLYECSGYA